MTAAHPLESEAWKVASELRREWRLSLPELMSELHRRNISVTYDELRYIAEMWGTQTGISVAPLWLGDFIGQYLKPLRPASILDPFAQSLLLPTISEVSGAADGVGLVLSPEVHEMLMLAGADNRISWIHTGDYYMRDVSGRTYQEPWFESVQKQFDAVVSLPPLGNPKQIATIRVGNEEVTFKDNPTYITLFQACNLLTSNGAALFVTTPGFPRPEEHWVYAHLPQFGLYIDAVLSIPSRALPGVGVETILVIVRRNEPEHIFIGQLSTDTAHNQALLENLQARKRGDDVSLGRLVDAAHTTSFRAVANQERIRALAGQMGYPPVRLADVAVSVERVYPNRRSDFLERPNTVYLPIIGRAVAVTSASEFTIKPENYIQIALHPDRALALYVAGFFNTPLGQLIREQALSGVYIPKISKQSLGTVQLYLPDLQTQIKTIEAATKITNLITELRELQDQVWARPRQLGRTIAAVGQVNREETLTGWLDFLPFPLASILWTYNTSGGDDEKRFRHLLHFFEALAEFYAIVLLSGFMNDTAEFEKARDEYTKAIPASSRQHGSFGIWVQIGSSLSKRARSMVNKNSEERQRCMDMFNTTNQEVLNMLLSSQIIGTLQNVNSDRNDWGGHGGFLPHARARELRAILENHLSTVRGVISHNWQNYQLIRPGLGRYSKGKYDYLVELVMGRSTPFESNRITTTVVLEDGQLYLHTPNESTALKLVPLVRVMQSPESVDNACYFYNRFEGSKVRFVTYQFAREGDIVEAFPDTVEALNTILN